MSYLDSPGAGGYFDAGEAHKGLKYASGEGKPAFFVWRECLANGPTWLTTGEWPAGGGPVHGGGCSCRATGIADAGGRGWLLLGVVAFLARRRGKGGP
jgi:MYXO-CTERM domain-containing protein